MIKPVTVKGVTIGEGIPKICVPIVGETLSQLAEEASSLKTLDLDVVEWRVDFFKDVENIDQVIEALTMIREILTEVPIVFTFRSAKEGGNKKVSTAYYFALNQAVIETGMVDIIDVELFTEGQDIRTLIKAAHLHNICVIVSNHDFFRRLQKKKLFHGCVKPRNWEEICLK